MTDINLPGITMTEQPDGRVRLTLDRLMQADTAITIIAAIVAACGHRPSSYTQSQLVDMLNHIDEHGGPK